MENRKKAAQTLMGVPMSETQGHKGFYISRGVDGVLTKLFNLTCLDLTAGNGISPIQWNKLMIEYMRKMEASKVAMDRTSIRGNTNKELRRPGMTWKVYCKGLRFLRMDCFCFNLNLTFEDGSEQHSYITAAFEKKSQYRDRLPKNKHANPNAKIGSSAKSHIPFAANAGGTLARLFHSLCLDYTSGEGLGEARFTALLDGYIAKHHQGIDLKERQALRSDLKKKFRAGSMTWKVFCKAMRFLQVQSMTITVEAVRDDGVHSTVDSEVIFSERKKAK